MATTSAKPDVNTLLHAVGRRVLCGVTAVGDLSVFAFRMLRWMFVRFPRRSVLLHSLYQTGVLSVPVVVVTGAFIGMVLAV